MSTLHQLREGINEAWDSVRDGWQKFYRRAAGALTRFTPGKKHGSEEHESKELSTRNTGWGVLAAEVFDDADKIIVRLETPGMEESDFDLQILNDYLVIRGEKQIEREHTEGRYHVTECAYGCFERAIPLPDEVEADNAKAVYKKGVLRVELPKTASRRRKKIKVNVH